MQPGYAYYKYLNTQTNTHKSQNKPWASNIANSNQYILRHNKNKAQETEHAYLSKIRPIYCLSLTCIIEIEGQGFYPWIETKDFSNISSQYIKSVHILPI